MKFSEKFIEKLKVSDRIQDIREAHGFGIRVLPSGVKTWFFIYRIDGNRRFMNLGHYPSISLAEARRRYRAAYDLYEQGQDPVAQVQIKKKARREAKTVSELVETYLEEHAKPRKRSWAKDEQILNRDVVPYLGSRKAEDITKDDITDTLKRIMGRGSPGMANNTFQIIRKMFNFAKDNSIVPRSPCAEVKMPAEKVERDRVLTESEIKSFWENVDNCPLSSEVKRALKLILVTAQRPGEIIGMHTSEIDGRWWTIPAKRSKNGKAHRVYLTDTALNLIGDTSGKGYIFPTPHKTKTQSIHAHALPIAVKRNLKVKVKVDGKTEEINRLGVSPFTPHDLRRTAASNLAGLGYRDEIIDAVLNHAKKGVIKVYVHHSYSKEKKDALERWEKKLALIVAGDKRSSIPFLINKKLVSRLTSNK